MEIMERIRALKSLTLVFLESLAKKYTMKLAAMAIGAKRRRVMKQYHHGRYSFKSWKKVTLINVTARTKIRIAMNIIPHLIGRQPKQDASPTLSWEHAHKQQQHGLKLYMSSPEFYVSELDLAASAAAAALASSASFASFAFFSYADLESSSFFCSGCSPSAFVFGTSLSRSVMA